MKTLITIILMLLPVLHCPAQHTQGFSAAYYDTDCLYDTIPSRFYDDSDYTPQGHLRWDSGRYRRKVECTARVIDSLCTDVVALYGVENEQVVRDIAAACSSDYAYVHATADADNGLDFALLYFGDRFVPERTVRWNNALCIHGTAAGVPLAIIITHRCTSLGVLAARLRRMYGEDINIMIMGTPNKLNFPEYGLRDATAPAERAGRGNSCTAGRWRMRDRIATNMSGIAVCDVYAARWMLSRTGEPAPTYDRTRYRGGCGRYLPLFIYFDETFAH